MYLYLIVSNYSSVVGMHVVPISLHGTWIILNILEVSFLSTKMTDITFSETDINFLTKISQTRRTSRGSLLKIVL